MHTRSISPVLGIALLTMAMTVGCTATPVPDPPVSDPAVTDPAPPGDVDADDCVVGIWNLDVGDYATSSEDFLLATGIPLESFAMGGSGKLTFTDDGLVAVDMGLRTEVTVAGVPLGTSSDYDASGAWSRTGEDTLQLDGWSRTTDEPDRPDEPDIPPELEVPGLDLTQLRDVTAKCTVDTLLLQGADAPFSARWTR